MIDVGEKREFLVWLINNVSFQRREVIWILNYLINHEAILRNVHIVEQALETKRGLVFRDITQREEPMVFSIEGHQFSNSDQIFHEIRLHWQQPLYLECIFQIHGKMHNIYPFLRTIPHFLGMIMLVKRS